MTGRPRLITFAPMIDSETWRLLLRQYGIAFEEEPHAFIWGSLLSLVRAGSLQVPALVGAGLSMVGPEQAIERWDADEPPGRGLVPPDPAASAAARRDWAQFHGTLAAATARFAYYHLLPHRDLLIGPFTAGIPPGDQRFTRMAYPLQRAILTLLLQLSDKNAAEALATIRRVFDATDRRVADGRRYLQGDRITLGDVALAAAAAPVTLPAGNASPIPAFEVLPPAFKDVVAEMRARPTGQFVRRLYESGLEPR